MELRRDYHLCIQSFPPKAPITVVEERAIAPAGSGKCEAVTKTTIFRSQVAPTVGLVKDTFRRQRKRNE